MVQREDNGSPVRPSPQDGKTRIVHLTTVHHPFDPRIFYKQLASLSEAGFDAHLIAPHHQAERKEGVTIHPLPKPENRWQRLALQPTVFRAARSLEADLYQVHDPELILLAFLLRSRTGARLIYDMHEDYRAKGVLVGRALRVLERWCFRWVDHVLLAEKSYRAVVGGKKVPATYIGNYFKPIGEGGRTATQAEETSSPQPFRLLYTGTISNTRGLRTILDLASTVRQSDRSASLDIVGICRYPDQRKAAEDRIERERLHSVVNRVGWDAYVSPSAMPPHYRRADVGLGLLEAHPNVVGSIPTKFFEYLHYGLPIICSDFPLWRDFIDENECGAVVPPGDVDAVLDVLARWRRRPELYRTYAQNARAAAPKYRWEKMARRLVEVYRQVLGDAEEDMPALEQERGGSE